MVGLGVLRVCWVSDVVLGCITLLLFYWLLLVSLVC